MGKKLHSSPLETFQEPLINMTPLIDVVFVLLISFIVIAPLLEMDRVELAGGAPSPNHLPIQVQDASSIQIRVMKDNSIFFNGQPISLQELSSLVREAKKQNPKARPQLFHDKQAYFGTYQSVKNILEAAGFQELDIVLSPA